MPEAKQAQQYLESSVIGYARNYDYLKKVVAEFKSALDKVNSRARYLYDFLQQIVGQTKCEETRDTRDAMWLSQDFYDGAPEGLIDESEMITSEEARSQLEGAISFYEKQMYKIENVRGKLIPLSEEAQRAFSSSPEECRIVLGDEGAYIIEKKLLYLAKDTKKIGELEELAAYKLDKGH